MVICLKSRIRSYNTLIIFILICSTQTLYHISLVSLGISDFSAVLLCPRYDFPSSLNHVELEAFLLIFFNCLILCYSFVSKMSSIISKKNFFFFVSLFHFTKMSFNDRLFRSPLLS